MDSRRLPKAIGAMIRDYRIKQVSELTEQETNQETNQTLIRRSRRPELAIVPS